MSTRSEADIRLTIANHIAGLVKQCRQALQHKSLVGIPGLKDLPPAYMTIALSLMTGVTSRSDLNIFNCSSFELSMHVTIEVLNKIRYALIRDQAKDWGLDSERACRLFNLDYQSVRCGLKHIKAGA